MINFILGKKKKKKNLVTQKYTFLVKETTKKEIYGNNKAASTKSILKTQWNKKLTKQKSLTPTSLHSNQTVQKSLLTKTRILNPERHTPPINNLNETLKKKKKRKEFHILEPSTKHFNPQT